MLKDDEQTWLYTTETDEPAIVTESPEEVARKVLEYRLAMRDYLQGIQDKLIREFRRNNQEVIKRFLERLSIIKRHGKRHRASTVSKIWPDVLNFKNPIAKYAQAIVSAARLAQRSPR